MNFLFRGAIGAAVALLCAQAGAQASDATLPSVTITGNPLGDPNRVAPASALAGTDLTLRVQPTLGETLQGQPGIASTYFGPTASRPILRGLDGDRIRILNNGGGLLDASGLSFDHAIAADPISVERIEVLRGPGALLYGGTAVGGVVNLIDNRIPREPMPGVAGRADVGLASGSRERGGGLRVEGGNERFGLHADAFDRRTSDVRVPRELECTRDGIARMARRLCNSAGHARGGAVGGSAFFDRGYLGASLSSYRNDYGAASEDEVTIGMRAERVAVEGQWRDPGGWVRSVTGRWSHTDYRHTEFDAGEPGTEFRSRGQDARVELRHAPLGGWEGVVGVQWDRSRFAADGEEAFAPYSRTRQAALFVHEELPLSWGRLSAGARVEQVSVRSLGHPVLDRFATGERRFTPASAAIGVQWDLAPGWQLSGQLARSERAPRDYELFANGPHVATGAYEIGRPDLGIERATQADIGLRWQRGDHEFRVHAFTAHFTDYVALLATGGVREEEGESLPEYAYTPVSARFRGLEAQGQVRLLDGPDRVDLLLRGDLVRADNRTAGEALPRIPPWRIGATLKWQRGPWALSVGADHHGRQARVPQGEQTVAGYTLWNAAITHRARAGATTLLWYARLDNATDRLAYSAASILTQTAPGRTPLPGRSVKVGLQVDF